MSIRSLNRLLTKIGEVTPQRDKSSLASQESGSFYSTFGTREEFGSESSANGRDISSERAPLLTSSTPCVEHLTATNQKKATVLDLLRSPRLPLALTATVVMAVVFSALETVCQPLSSFCESSLGELCILTRGLMTDSPTICDGDIPLVVRWRRVHLRRLMRSELRRSLHWEGNQPIWRAHSRGCGFPGRFRCLDLNATGRKQHNRTDRSADQPVARSGAGDCDYRGHRHDRGVPSD